MWEWREIKLEVSVDKVKVNNLMTELSIKEAKWCENKENLKLEVSVDKVKVNNLVTELSIKEAKWCENE